MVGVHMQVYFMFHMIYEKVRNKYGKYGNDKIFSDFDYVRDNFRNSIPDKSCMNARRGNAKSKTKQFSAL